MGIQPDAITSSRYEITSTLQKHLTGGDYVRFLFLTDGERFAMAGREGAVGGRAPRREHDLRVDSPTAGYRGNLSDRSGPVDLELLEHCAQLAKQCSTEIRTASYLPHPPLLDELGLLSALRWLVDGFRRRSALEVTLDLPAGMVRLPREHELCMFRIAQDGR